MDRMGDWRAVSDIAGGRRGGWACGTVCSRIAGAPAASQPVGLNSESQRHQMDTSIAAAGGRQGAGLSSQRVLEACLWLQCAVLGTQVRSSASGQVRPPSPPKSRVSRGTSSSSSQPVAAPPLQPMGRLLGSARPVRSRPLPKYQGWGSASPSHRDPGSCTARQGLRHTSGAAPGTADSVPAVQCRAPLQCSTAEPPQGRPAAPDPAPWA